MATETKPSKPVAIIALVTLVAIIATGYFTLVSGDEYLPSENVFENTQTIVIL